MVLTATRPFKLILLVVLLISSLAGAVTAVRVRVRHRPVKRSMYQRMRHPWWHPVFPPSHESLLRQNAEIDRLALSRYQDEVDLSAAVANGELVALPLSPALVVDPRLDPSRRYCRPWTARFLTDLSNDFYAKFHVPLMVDSAVRTVEVQKKLRKRNRNAAPYEGEVASSHLAGLTVDLARKRMTKQQVKWVEFRLLYYYARHWVIVEEEYYQLCFHIEVSGQYGEPIKTIPITLENNTIPDTDQ